MEKVIFKRHIKLWEIAYNSKRRINLVTIEVKIKEVTGDGKTIDLELVNSWKTLSISGNIWDNLQTDYNPDIVSGGQNIDEIRKHFRTNIQVRRIHDIWKQYHLNDLKSATRRQAELLKECDSYDYSVRKAFLLGKGLLNDNGHRYGSGWLIEIIPDEIIQEVQEIFNSFEEFRGF